MTCASAVLKHLLAAPLARVAGAASEAATAGGRRGSTGRNGFHVSAPPGRRRWSSSPHAAAADGPQVQHDRWQAGEAAAAAARPPLPPGAARGHLVLYSKPGCCLCDGLKEKLDVVLSTGGEGGLGGVRLEVRDITTKREWEAAYQYEIPVLARVTPDGAEVPIPRSSPREPIGRLQAKLSAAFGPES